MLRVLARIIADLADSSGINTSASGVGHRIEAWVDDNPESVDLSSYYQGKTDTYREGTVEYPLAGLAAGSHHLRLRAWDTYNNASVSQTVFDVISKVGLQLSNIYNFPNPFSSSTRSSRRANASSRESKVNRNALRSAAGPK